MASATAAPSVAPSAAALLALALFLLACAPSPAAAQTNSLSGGNFLVPPQGSGFDRSVASTGFLSIDCFPSERRVKFTIQNGFLNYVSRDFVVGFSTEGGAENARAFQDIRPGESESLYISPLNPSQKIANRRNELVLYGDNPYTGFTQIFSTRVPDCGPIRENRDDDDARGDDDDGGFFDVAKMIDNDTVLNSVLPWLILIGIISIIAILTSVGMYMFSRWRQTENNGTANADAEMTLLDRANGIHSKWIQQRESFIKNSLLYYDKVVSTA